MILDNGERTVHENGFQRDMHEGKGRMDLLPWRGIMDLSKHCEEGAKKYGERNIDLGAPQKSLIDSAFRHLAKYHIGMTDESHLRACAWNILWALEQEVCRPDLIQVYREEMKGPQVDEETKDLFGEELRGKLKELTIATSEINDKYDEFKEAIKVVRDELDECRCVETTCFYNEDGFCEAVGVPYDPQLGKDCPGFMED